jgi:hypothetical protein
MTLVGVGALKAAALMILVTALVIRDGPCDKRSEIRLVNLVTLVILARVQVLEGGVVVPGEEEGCTQADEDAEDDHQ